MLKTFIFYCLISVHFSLIIAQVPTDSIWQEIRKSDNPNHQFELYYDLMFHYIFDDLDSANILVSKMLALSEKTNDPDHTLKCQYWQGLIQRFDGAYDQSLQVFRDLASNATAVNDTMLGRAFFNIGVINNIIGQNDSAVHYLIKYLEIQKAINDKGAVAQAYNSLGIIFSEMDNNEQAIHYYMQSYNAFQNLRNLNGIGLAAGNIASYYNDINEPDSLLKYGQITLDAGKELDQKRSIGFGNYLMSEAHLSKKQPLEAIKFAENSIQIHREQGEIKLLVYAYHVLGEAQLMQSNNKLAERQLQKALLLADSIKLIQYQMKTSNRLADLYRQEENWKLSDYYYRKYASLKDSAHAIEKEKATQEIHEKYQSALKDITLAKQEKQIIRQNTNRKLMLMLMTGLTGIFFFIWYRQQSKSKLRLSKIDALQKQQRLIALDFMIQGQEEERKRIAQELHDGLGGLLYSARTQLLRVQQEMQKLERLDFFQKAEKLIVHASHEVRRISHDMMPAALATLGIREAIEDLVDTIESSSDITTELYCTLENNTLTDPQAVNVYRILQELTNNTLKYGNATNIIIRLTNEGKNIMLFYSDNGVGFDLERMKLKNGLGIKTIESRTAYLNGKLSIDTEPDAGCSYSIIFPADLDNGSDNPRFSIH